MKVQQTPLPYDYEALEPHVSSETMRFHYDKHHAGYIRKLNALIEGTPYETLDLEQIITRARITADIDVLNNAMQAWNHSFLWESMSPNGGKKPEGRIMEAVEREFGDIDRFKKAFREKAISLFGSGWVWLVADGSDLQIITTGNADSPIGTNLTPLLTLDVWEHAYYIDHRNERAAYVDDFLNNLINWNFAAANLDWNKKKKAA